MTMGLLTVDGKKKSKFDESKNSKFDETSKIDQKKNVIENPQKYNIPKINKRRSLKIKNWIIKDAKEKKLK